MSPSRSNQAARKQRALWISLLFTVVIAFGSFGAVLLAGWSPRLGLDLAGGLSVVYQPATKASQSDLNETVTIITNRVNGLGVSGATVGTQGQDIVVSIPGISNGRQVLRSIGSTAQLLFRPDLCNAPAYDGKGKNAAAATKPSLLPTTCAASSQLTAANLKVTPDSSTSAGYTSNQAIPADPALAAYPSTLPADDSKSTVVLLKGLSNSGCTRCLLDKTTVTGHIVKSAVAQLTSANQWVVNYTLTSTGSAQWDAMAKANFHQIIAIELDGVVQSAPIIQPSQSSFTSFNGQGEISGGLNEAQAKNLAQAMNFGSLPVRLVAETTETVSPTLGHSALIAGLGAGLVGLVLVLIYTILYYRILGIVVVSGLVVTSALLWAIISALGHTTFAPSFTLAGVTGLIVSVGITVDSYIVYFERLKDETRSGRTVRTSVDRGFQSAFRTVLAADLVSLIGAVLLYFLTVSDVKGFAFFLGLSTLLDILITYCFTRPLVILLGRNERIAGAKTIGVSEGLAVEREPVGAAR